MREQIIFNTWIPFPTYIKILYRHINAVLAVLKGSIMAIRYNTLSLTFSKYCRRHTGSQILPSEHKNLNDTKVTI